MESQEGLTLGEVWFAVRKKIWIILIFSIILALGATAAFYYVVNPYSAVYRLDFTLSYPDRDSQKYPDGAPFYYQDMISLSSLEEAKASDKKFSAIDVQAMLEGDDIAITVADPDSEPGRKGEYSLTAQSSYFPSRSVATAFLRAVAEIPVTRSKECAENMIYTLDEEIFESASFEDRLALLSNQRSRLLEQYQEWSELFRDSYAVEGKTLKNYRAETAVIFGEELQSELREELAGYGYVPLDKLPAKIAELKAERNINEAKIAALTEALQGMTVSLVIAGQGSGGLSETLAELIVRNQEIDAEIAALTEENIRTFEARIEAEYQKLQAAAIRLQAVATILFRQESRAVFSATNAVLEGDTSLVAVGLGGFLVSLILLSGIAVFADLTKRRREELRAEKVPSSEKTVQRKGAAAFFQREAESESHANESDISQRMA